MFLIIVTMSFRFLWLCFNQAVFLYYQKVVLGKLPPRKIAPSPNSNANPKPNPNPERGRGAIFLGGNFPDTQKVKTKIQIFRERNKL